LTITKNVKMVGVNPGPSNSSLVLIVPPAAGLANNAPDLDGGSATAAQIAVQGATVSISNVTVDAAGNTVGANNGCGWDIVGIIYQNASGTVNNNVVRNDYLAPFGSLGGCQGGLGIYVETSAGNASNVVITNNEVENYQKNGITGNDSGTNVTIKGNTVLGMGPTDGAAENSVQVAFGATGSVTSNTVGDDIWAPDTFGDTGNAAAGILIYASAGVKVSGNIVHSTQYGIAVVGDGNGDGDSATITTNTVSNTYLYDAIDICGAGSATVSGNTLNASDEAAIHLDSSCTGASTGNTGGSNKVDDACAALLEGTGSGGSVTTTSNLNVANLVLTGSDVCQLSNNGARHQPRHARGHLRPFR
jgi:hypothetical protein